MRNSYFAVLFHLLLPLVLSSPTLGSTDFSMLPALTQQHPERKVLLDITRVDSRINSRIDSRIVCVGELGIIIFSDDNGKSWQQATVPASVTLTAVYFSSPSHGWAVGHQGVILHSDDGGQHWQLQFSGRDAYTQAIAMVKQQLEKDQAALKAGSATTSKNSLKMRVDDATYQLEELNKALKNGPSEPLLDIWFADEKNGMAAGAYGLLLTTSDGGKQWQLHPQYLGNIDKFHFYAIHKNQHGSIFLAGEAGTLWRSSDNGQQWQTLSAPYQGSLFGITETKEGALLLYGLRGHLFSSRDNGESWQTIDSSQQATLLAGATSRTGQIVLVGSSGTILVSPDNTKPFEIFLLKNRSTLSGVLPLENNRLLLVGKSGLQSYLPEHPQNTSMEGKH